MGAFSGAFCLPAPPKQISFIALSYEYFFKKIQCTRLGAKVAPKKVLKEAMLMDKNVAH